MRLAVPVVLLIAVSLAHAAGEAPSHGLFDAYVLRREGGAIAVAPRNVDRLDPSDALRTGWEVFRGRHGGGWSIYVDERTGMPTLVSGRGIEWFDSGDLDSLTLDEVEARVRAFLEENESLLGRWAGAIELDAEASGEIRDGHWQVVLRQAVNGVRVENARLDFHVNRGTLTMFGSSHWGSFAVQGAPTIDAFEARAFLDAYLDTETSAFEPAAEPELVLLALDAESSPERPRRWTGPRGMGLRHALVWRFQFHDPATSAVWVGEIDAHTGAVRAFFDGAHYAAVRGGVLPVSPDGDCAQGGCEIQGYPTPFADRNEVGTGTVPADAFGNYTCSDPASTVETRLDGPYARVEDECGEFLETGVCGEGIDLGMKAGENCVVEPGASPGNTAAARSAYYHVNRVNQVARFYNPGISWLNSAVRIHSNWDQVCNASYGGGGIYVYRYGTSWADCANSGEVAGIVTHEWGHGLDFNDGGGEDNTSEAYADIVSMLSSRGSCFGPGFFRNGKVCSGYGDTCLTCTGFRDHDWAARTANTPATPQVFVQENCDEGSGPCGRSVHCETYPIGESIFDLATRDLPATGVDVDTAWQIVERLWYTTRQGSGGDIYTCALPDSDSCAASSWYQRMRVADDDDGDLANGTPHAAALFAAFDRHAIACGLAEDPENQSASSCPALAAPELTVAVTEAGTELSWTPVIGAAEYTVHRGERGCGRGQVPIAVVTAPTTTYLDAVADPGLPVDYRVQAVGTNTVCRSPVSDCEIAGAGPRLQMNGHRLVEDGNNDDSDGFLEPGETVHVPVTLFNGGTAEALEVSGRLRTVDPAHGRVVGPIATWPDLASGIESESDAPHFELTLFENGIGCGDTLSLELEKNAAGAPTRTNRFDRFLGEKSRDFHREDGSTILRQTQEPLLSTLEVTEARTLAELDVTVNIGHPDNSELIVELTSPTGTTVRLHDSWAGPGPSGLYTRYDLETDPSGPGTMADFVGETLAGTWTLSVEDVRWGAYGTAVLTSWTLHATAEGAFDCDVRVCAEPVPAESPSTLHVDKTIDGGDGSVDLVFTWDAVAGVAGYHVLHSPSAAWDSTVDLTGRTDGSTTLTVEDGVAITPPAAFFQVRSVNACNQEAP